LIIKKNPQTRWPIELIRGSIMETVFANHIYSPLEFICWSRNILVETTCPYFDSIASRSVSLKWGGKFAIYKFVGSCSCCCVVVVCNWVRSGWCGVVDCWLWTVGCCWNWIDLNWFVGFDGGFRFVCFGFTQINVTQKQLA